jgi:AAA domain/Transcriptional regulator, AbiEi antitoxin
MTGPLDKDGFCTVCGEYEDYCECPDEATQDDADSDTPDTAQESVSENTGPLTRHSDTSDTSDSVTEEHEPEKPKKAPKYELRDGAWLDGQRFDPLAYNVPGLMPAGFGIIAAPPKAGKSLLILDWLLAAATGGQALGRLRVGPARDVLYLALEDGDRRLQGRCRQLLADREPIPDRLRYILTVPPGQVLAVLNDALERYPETRLVVLDTLGRIMPMPFQGETTYQRDYRVGIALKRVADERPGLTIVVIHHTRKAVADDFIDSISGTHGLAGAADTIIMLSRGRGRREGTLRVTGRDVVEADYAVIFSGGAWSLDGATLDEARANVRRRAETGSLGGRSAEIIEFTREHAEGVTNAQVRAKFGKDADTYLKRLHESGRLAKPKRGLYVVSEVSEVSDSQVSGTGNSDTGQLDLSEVSETSEEDDS